MSHEQLRRRTDAPAGSSWGLFGRTTRLLNFIDRSCVRRRRLVPAARCSISITGSMHSTRRSPHTATARGTASSAERTPSRRFHRRPCCRVRRGVDGACGTGAMGRLLSRAPDGRSRRGPTIGNRSPRRHVGRGVLIDIERHLRRAGASTIAPARAIRAPARRSRAPASRPSGDILLILFGWLDSFQRTRPRNATCRQPTSRDSSVATRSQLGQPHHDRRLGQCRLRGHPPGRLAVRDRARPGRWCKPLARRPDAPDPIALLGLCIGELWDLEALAADCATTGVYDCMIVAKPLNLVGGVGSPANAVAIK